MKPAKRMESGKMLQIIRITFIGVSVMTPCLNERCKGEFGLDTKRDGATYSDSEDGQRTSDSLTFQLQRLIVA